VYVGDPNRTDGLGDNRVERKAECDDKDESPGEDLHDPMPVATRMYVDGRNPPSEDKESKADEGDDADVAVAVD